MQSESTIEVETGDKNIIHELFGGLSLAPYGIFLLLSAYAFAQGWLNWETNAGPPYLGGVLAWLFDRLIRWYYRKKYNFTFFSDIREAQKKGIQTFAKGGLILVGLIGLFATWYLDANFHSRIRFMPLWFGLFVCLRGMDWLRKRWVGLGSLHIALGVVPIAMSIMPLILGVSSENKYFGLEGIYELSAMGLVIIVVSVMEHLIFLNVQSSEIN